MASAQFEIQDIPLRRCGRKGQLWTAPALGDFKAIPTTGV
jgi:hypothetical protein